MGSKKDVKRLVDFLKAKLSVTELALLLDVLNLGSKKENDDLKELLAGHLETLWKDYAYTPKPGEMFRA